MSRPASARESLSLCVSAPSPYATPLTMRWPIVQRQAAVGAPFRPSAPHPHRHSDPNPVRTRRCTGVIDSFKHLRHRLRAPLAAPCDGRKSVAKCRRLAATTGLTILSDGRIVVENVARSSTVTLSISQ